MDSSTPTSETIENANMFTLEYAFTYGSGKSNFEEKISTTVNQKKRKENQKFIKRLCHENTVQILTNEKH